MKKILLLILINVFASCTKPKVTNWQGTYYPKGCLTCDEFYEYSPIFKTFKECKSWADTKIKDTIDKVSCGRQCEFEGQLDMSKCDLVVRSWAVPLFPDSPTFDTYKE